MVEIGNPFSINVQFVPLSVERIIPPDTEANIVVFLTVIAVTNV